MTWVDELTPEQRARWTDRAREPFHLFQTTDEELSVPPNFCLGRTPQERMEYLEHTRWVIFGEAAMTAPFVRCYGSRKMGKESDPMNVVHF
ncbi:MAG: hypothetical protein EBS05_20350 [Proteobacteria bacterium]|jgi:hypothetical protein|nr:hypothetical protein [Pseudomonadota bacterium]NDF01534.1 hypothetical protein [Verrucomicrobiota bacterium]